MHTNTHNADDCQLDAVTFNGQLGKFLHGRIEPALSGVTVTMSKQIAAAAELKQYTAVSNDQGTYELVLLRTYNVIRNHVLFVVNFRIGPLRTFEAFDYTAERAGYVFTPTPDKPGHFRAYKLSELLIKVYI